MFRRLATGLIAATVAVAALALLPQSASAFITNQTALAVLYELGDDWEDAAVAERHGCDAGFHRYGDHCHSSWDTASGNFTSWDLRRVMSFVLWRVHGAGGGPANNHGTVNAWNPSLFASDQNVTESQLRVMWGDYRNAYPPPDRGFPSDAPLPPPYSPPDEEFVSRAPPRPVGCSHLSGDNREVTANGQQWYWLDHANRCVRWFNGERLVGSVVQVAAGQEVPPPPAAHHREPDYSNQFNSANPPACIDSTTTNYDPRYFRVIVSDKDGDGFEESRRLDRIVGTTCSSPNDATANDGTSTTQEATTTDETARQSTTTETTTLQVETSGETTSGVTVTPQAAVQRATPSEPPAVCVVVATPSDSPNPELVGATVSAESADTWTASGWTLSCPD